MRGCFFFQAEDGIRDGHVTGVQTCALPISDDGGEGSLRWAIERNNTAPGRFRIEIAPAGAAPQVIKPASPLPAIKGPVAIEGAAWKRSGEFTILDGSG